MNGAGVLRSAFARGETIVAPGVFDGLSARIVERAGFGAVYASGGAIARSTGVPDLGLLSLAEVVARLEAIVDAVDVPVVADADTGFGGALNVERTVRAFARAGVAALHLEDQTFPKRCGHLDGKSLIPVEEMGEKVRAACEAAGDSGPVIIARTDAIAVEGFEAALERARAYAEAGAEMLFVEAPTTEPQIAEIARRVPGWKLINMFEGGKTPLLSTARLREIGYQLVIIPSDLQRAAIRAMERAAGTIREEGSTAGFSANMSSFAERDALVDTALYLERGFRYSETARERPRH
ncbi:MAG TPA: oxaloacetate decarboxylase [Candidatus Binatia bacterium]|nr:oxaloacetate decarboxylase [Candidatus Binatia bacterium]